MIKKEKLYNLAEALSLDDYEDDDEFITTKKAGNARENDQFDLFIQSRIQEANLEPLTPFEQILVEKINADKTGIYDKRLKVADTSELIIVLQRSAKYFGMEGNYNWIDTVNVDSFLKLFKNAFGNNVKTFNGDISRWDTSNVENMLHTFQDCAALTCDISHWDTSNVENWDTGSYAGTNSTFKAICKKLKFPSLWKY